jgi:hypothetical protein
VLVATGLAVGKHYVDRELAKRPPVVVIVELALVRSIGGARANPTELDALYRRIDVSSVELSEAGYLVLRRNALHASPASAEVQP